MTLWIVPIFGAAAILEKFGVPKSDSSKSISSYEIKDILRQTGQRESRQLLSMRK